jgi:NitT/TauT family transport system substrate-binding protein
MFRNKSRLISASTLLLVMALMSGLLVGCGAAKKPAEVSVQLKWLHQVQFAGLYVAEQEGYYADENLTVALKPVDFEQQLSVEKVLSGDSDFGIAAPEEVLIARSEGKPVRALAVFFRVGPNVFLATPESEIRSPHDLVGQKIALAPGSSTIIYQAMMGRLAIDRSQIEEIPVNVWDLWECWEIAPLCSNYATNGPVILDQAGEEYGLIWPSDYGITWYGDVLITTDEMMTEQPDVVERFVRATLKGWRQAVSNPELAVSATMAFDAELDKSFQTAAMKASIPLIDTGEDQIGWMRPEAWQQINDILVDQDVIGAAVDVKTAYTNEFVEKAQ